jgi:molybdopterin-guanine dinucleotide biosynthesis protein A
MTPTNAALRPPLCGAILVGGESRRMGRPKHLLELDGETFVERIGRVLEAVTPGWSALGGGELPPALAASHRLADVPSVRGPLAGLLAAFTYRPDAAWLVLACDQPYVSAALLQWLVDHRRASSAAVLPRLLADHVEPFPGIYEPAAAEALRWLAAETGSASSLQRLPQIAPVTTPRVPEGLAEHLAGFNAPADLERLGS